METNANAREEGNKDIENNKDPTIAGHQLQVFRLWDRHDRGVGLCLGRNHDHHRHH